MRLPITMLIFSSEKSERPKLFFNCTLVFPLAPTPSILKTTAILKGDINIFGWEASRCLAIPCVTKNNHQ